MPISNKATVFAVMKEAAEGTITVPASGADFLPIQADLEMNAELEKLDNEEMKNSLGSAKKITGVENPKASFSHYMKHSGVEGQAPAWGKLIESIFGGVKVASTEYQTVAGSTTSAVKVADASVFRVGETLLVKDATNGYSIAVIHSLDTVTDMMTLGFKLAAAPASGVSLGKAVTYFPVNDTTHPSLTLWRYIGNGGTKDMVRGARVTELSFSAEAGQLINAKVSMEGVEYFFNHVEITDSNKHIDFTDDQGTQAATVAKGVYKTPQELAVAVQAALDAASTETMTVTYSNSTGKFTITSGSTLFSILWLSGTNTATSIGTTLGFTVAADLTLATTYTSEGAQTYAAPYTPSFDAADPVVAKGHIVYFGDALDNVCFGPSSVEVTVTNDRKVIDSICSESGKLGSVITGRSVSVKCKALLNKYDADKFDRMLGNKDSRFMYCGGTKSGGNFVAGKCFSAYLPYCTVDTCTISDDESLVTLEFELSAFVPNDGSSEVFLGFV
jgi:hypothetical protein